MNYFESFSLLSKMSDQHIHLNDSHKHFYIVDKDGNALYFNDTFTEFLRTDDSLDLTSQFNTYDLIQGHEADKVRVNNGKVLTQQKDFIFSENFTYGDNETKTAISFKSPFRDSNRNVNGIIGLSFIKNDDKVKDKFKLTPKKLNCLYFLVKGYTYPEIAKQMHLSPRTIEHYMEDLYVQFLCSKRSELISHAMKIDEIKLRFLSEL
jgi:DNA-binding CsgD family transcriptional regulator